MTLAVPKADTFVNNSNVKAAVTESLANFTDVPSAYVDVDLAEIAQVQRRLRPQQLNAPEHVVLTYAVAVSGGAPESITTTGAEVGATMTASNKELTDVLSSSVEASVGQDFAFAVQDTIEPTVVIEDVATGGKQGQEEGVSSGTGLVLTSVHLLIVAFLLVQVLTF
jgi:hypothetical protein